MRVLTATLFLILTMLQSVTFNLLYEAGMIPQETFQSLTVVFWLFSGLVIAYYFQVLMDIATGFGSDEPTMKAWAVFALIVATVAIPMFNARPEAYDIQTVIPISIYVGVIAGLPAFFQTPQWMNANEWLEERFDFIDTEEAV